MIRPRPTLHLGVTALAAVTLSACAGAPAAPTSEERGAATVFAPWAPATFARARAERRPVLLHLAASWCHWCHVMEE
ncbi:MAG: DUF255 domain-containing protein, partial [Myxococcales bacterium]|nr:DUF255 domain-containing protein [Myxococcales bacterium]